MALLRNFRMLWRPWFTMSCGGKEMGQFLRFRPLRVITFPGEHGKVKNLSAQVYRLHLFI